MKQTIIFDKRAEKEISSFTKQAQMKLRSLIQILSVYGRLNLPEGKKITKELFEIRIKSASQHRCLYAYYTKQTVIILSAFIKKKQKTPQKEINKAVSRLQEYKTSNI